MNSSNKSNCYSEYRFEFLQAARRAGADVSSYQHPDRGPDNGKLFIDVAQIGHSQSGRYHLVVSGTHGVEGYAGSDIQTAWLKGERSQAKEDVVFVLIHALNPWGMAWSRRECEDNSDLLRNMSGWQLAESHVNIEYDQLADALNPSEWSGPTRDRAELALAEYIKKYGQAELMKTVKAGQYNHPGGILYHGAQESWPTKMIKAILAEQVRQPQGIALTDIHTGFGKYQETIPISSYDANSDVTKRLVSWLGDGVMIAGYTELIPAHRTPPWQFVEDTYPDAEVTVLGLEFGTKSPEQFFDLVRSSNWLHCYGEHDSEEGSRISSDMKEYCYPESREWRDRITESGLHVIEEMTSGLLESTDNESTYP